VLDDLLPASLRTSVKDVVAPRTWLVVILRPTVCA